MIRPLTCLCLAAAFGSGLYLYSEKHRAELLDRAIGAVVLQTEEARARTVQLTTEWAMLNEPGRLQDKATRYLPQLKPLAPGQFVQLADLANRLPAPEAARPDAAPDAATDTAPATATEDGAAIADTGAPVPAASDQVATLTDRLPPQDPVQLAAPKPAPRMVAKADPRKRPVTLADRDSLHNAALAHGTMLPLAAPQPVHASVMSAMAHRVPKARPLVVAASGPAAPAYAAPSYIGSAIATGRSALPPPVPLGAGEQ